MVEMLFHLRLCCGRTEDTSPNITWMMYTARESGDHTFSVLTVPLTAMPPSGVSAQTSYL
jgi:hypothetical protein